MEYYLPNRNKTCSVNIEPIVIFDHKRLKRKSLIGHYIVHKHCSMDIVSGKQETTL